MPSVSGLNRQQRGRARDRVVQAALLAFNNAAEMHYMDPNDPEQAALRWDGIENHRNSWRGEFPINSDCSSFVTWCLWNALFLHFRLDDTVNGFDWNAGSTFSMLTHGRPVQHEGKVCRGDVVLYDPGGGFSSAHCTIIIGREDGVLKVISHGSELGPFKSNHNYRPVREIRRFI